MKKIAILGGGLAGLTAAWQLHRLGLPFTLYEASPRLGGIIETVHRDGFTVELGPDGWLTEKPSAAQLARELGLADDLLPSNDSTRRTYILRDRALLPIPDGMRLMVPTNPAALNRSPLFSPTAIAAFQAEPHRAAELKAAAPLADESVASFVQRHFGDEVLRTLAAPLLSGVLGGDVTQLSAHAVLAPFVTMERTDGSLILALQARTSRIHPNLSNPNLTNPDLSPTPDLAPDLAPALFTTLRSGLQTLTDQIAAHLPPSNVRLKTPIQAITRQGAHWLVHPSQNSAPEHSGSTPEPRSAAPEPRQAVPQPFSHILLATPGHVTRTLLAPLDPAAANLLPTQASSAIIVALAFHPPHTIPLPPGFGFLVPPSTPGHSLLACTFVDQKFPYRVPPGGQLLRAFFGAAAAETLLRRPDPDLVELALQELSAILGPLPTASLTPQFATVRRWPQSLPQYTVGHLTRMTELQTRLAQLPGLHLLGNSYSGVGLPDLIHQARTLAQTLAAQP